MIEYPNIRIQNPADSPKLKVQIFANSLKILQILQTQIWNDEWRLAVTITPDLEKSYTSCKRIGDIAQKGQKVPTWQRAKVYLEYIKHLSQNCVNGNSIPASPILPTGEPRDMIPQKVEATGRGVNSNLLSNHIFGDSQRILEDQINQINNSKSIYSTERRNRGHISKLRDIVPKISEFKNCDTRI